MNHTLDKLVYDLEKSTNQRLVGPLVLECSAELL